MASREVGKFLSPAEIEDIYLAFRGQQPNATEAEIATWMARWAEATYRIRMCLLLAAMELGEDADV